MPKAKIEQAKKLARLSSDCSFLLTHLIREKNKTEGAQILKSILEIAKDQKTLCLKASPTGWYSGGTCKVYQPNTEGQFLIPKENNIKAVCFTESTLLGLKAHFEVFKDPSSGHFAEYGIAFDRDLLIKKGANPCLNIRKSILNSTVENPTYYKKLYNFIPEELTGFVNIIHESFDATPEREWRIIGDFEFKLSEIMFVFCPEKDFDIFSKIQKKGKPALFDLNWLYRI